MSLHSPLKLYLHDVYRATDNSILYTCAKPYTDYLLKIPAEMPIAYEEADRYICLNKSTTTTESNLSLFTTHVLHPERGDEVRMARTGALVDYRVGAFLITRGHDHDLFDIVQRTGAFTESHARLVFKQLVHAIRGLHTRGIAHLDLKLEQFVCERETYALKIVDLAYSEANVPSHGYRVMSVQAGTKPWMAPEMLRVDVITGSRINVFASDMWQLGMMLFALLYGFPAFGRADVMHCAWFKMWLLDRDTYWKRVHEMKARCTQHGSTPGLSLACCDLLTELLDPNPNTRATMNQVQEHAWYNMNDFVGEKELAGDLKERLSCISRSNELSQ